VICAFDVEEITAVAETRLPPWAREVFPSVRAHMPWMDTPAGQIELLIGLDNSQWLPVFLEDSKEPAVNMRLMKSSFGHMFMVMGNRGTALYPRDETMRYRGDPTGNASPTQRWRRMSGWKGASEGDPSRDPRTGVGYPSKDPHPCREEWPLIMGLWGAGGPHPPGRSRRRQHRLEGRHRRRLGCPSATRQHLPRRVRVGEGEGG
jgi:hypothetical protein